MKKVKENVRHVGHTITYKETDNELEKNIQEC